MKKTFLSIALFAAATMAATAQQPAQPEVCQAAEYCAPVYNCAYDNCDQAPCLATYANLAHKYQEYGESGRRAELANGNKEVQQLYELHNHFKQHVDNSQLTTEQQLQLQLAQGCMGE